MNGNKYERLSNFKFKTQITVKEQLVVRNDMNVNKERRLLITQHSTN